MMQTMFNAMNENNHEQEKWIIYGLALAIALDPRA